ncbi:MAG: hypothetical protein IKE15_09315 [Clostridia bacterium]|nr:hypothetical protein [Clostridia bacterium]
MRRMTSMFRIIVLISFLLTALFLLPGNSCAETILDPGTPFTFNGHRYLPVGMTDNQEQIYEWTRTEIDTDYTVLLRIYCPDGAVTYDDAKLFREKITIYDRTKNEINYDIRKLLPYVKDSMFLFDIVMRLPDKPDPENAYLVLEGHDEWYPVNGLPPMEDDVRTVADSLTPFEYRGLRFTPVAVTDDQDFILQKTGTESDKFRIMVRFRCLDGLITRTDAEAFREAFRIYIYEPELGYKNGHSSLREILTAGNTFTDFDIVISLRSVFGLKDIFLQYGHEVCLRYLSALTEPLPENGTESLPVVTLKPTPTPEPTPEPTPSPTPVPTANPMTGSDRNTLEKKLQDILKKNKSIKYLPKSEKISIKGKILIAVFDMDGNLQENTLDNGFDHKMFSGLPKNRLATTFSEADTWVFIYPDPNHKLEGRYTNGSNAYTTTTRMAVITGKQLKAYDIGTAHNPTTISTDRPLDTKDHYAGLLTGYAIDALLNNLK